MVESCTEVHNALHVADSIDLCHVQRADASSGGRFSIKSLTTVTVLTASFALIFASALACLARIVTFLAVLLANPVFVLDIVSESRTLTLIASILEQFVSRQALHALGRPLGTAFGATDAWAALCLDKEGQRILIVCNVYTSLAIDHLVGTVGHKDEGLVNCLRPH